MAIHLFFPFFIITITTVILVASQGGGGHGGGDSGGGTGGRGNGIGIGIGRSSGSGSDSGSGSGSGSGGRGSDGYNGGGGGGGSHCESDKCQRIAIIIAIAVVGIFSLIILYACYKFVLQRLQYNLTGQHIPTNGDCVNVVPRCHTDETENIFIFRSGTWISRYHQYGKWHNQNRLSLSFDALKFEVRGKGNDDVGVFTIFGVYSTKTQRLSLIKTYQHDKGDPRENLGHNVVIQLTWNPNDRQFEGIWYVQTNQYHGENKFELKFEAPEQLL